MAEKATYKFDIKGIDCANCAAKLETKIKEIAGISNVVLNYMNETLVYDCDQDRAKEMEEAVRAVAAKEEPESVITAKGHSHHRHEHHHDHEEHDHCDCHCEEHEEETATYKFDIKGLDCANCAAKLEAKIKEIAGISNVVLNYMNETLVYDCDHDRAKELEEAVRALAAKEEPEAVITAKGHSHHHHEHHHDHEEHDHCDCHCEEHEEETATYKFDIKGIDCANCAAKLEAKIKEIDGLSNVVLNYMNETLVYDCDHDRAKEMEEAVRAVAAKEEPEAVITGKGHSHHHHEHDHEHHDHEECDGHCDVHEETEEVLTARSRKYSITGIDCANCAASLERKMAGVAGASNVQISFINSTLIFDCDEHDRERILKEMQTIADREEPGTVIAEYEKKTAKASKEDDDDDDSKVILYRLIIGAVLFVLGLFLKDTMQIIVMIGAYLVLGYDVLIKAVKGIGRGQVFDENFLMAVATLAAIWLKDYKEAAGVMLFYQIGEYFQDLAVARSRRSIGELMDIRAEYAHVKRGGTFVKTDPENVRVGEIIQVLAGEKVPLDGVVVSGASSLDVSSLTGESRPFDADTGSEVMSGSVNGSGVLEIEVTKAYEDSTVAKILDLVENQQNTKSSHENFITKFARVYTPAVVFSAIAVAVITAAVTGSVHDGIYRACTFLVISCPCALVISIPLSFFAGIGGLSSRGILVKGANLIEPLAQIKQVVLDKTGTITAGTFVPAEIHTAGTPEAQVLEDAAYAEIYSNHPIGAGICKAYAEKNGIAYDTWKETERSGSAEEIPGRGLRVHHDGHVILAGNRKLLEENGIACEEIKEAGTLVYVAKDGVYEGCIRMRDEIRADARDGIRRLQDNGRTCIIVSGDAQQISDAVAKEAGCAQAYGECLPEDKVVRVQELKKNGITAFVGDGVNDAPVLKAADIGFAMGAIGSDAAIEAADVILMDDKLTGIPFAMESAARILRVANENIYGAIIVKVLTLILGAFGIANMWMAIFADTGVALLCVLNALRLLRMAEKR